MKHATLQMIAKDVKIQIEWNPAMVAEYRLIGYENRLLAREDFNNDKVDAGDIGAGHTVTALYEISLVGEPGQRLDGLRYGVSKSTVAVRDEIAHLRLRYKLPSEGSSHLIEQPILPQTLQNSLQRTSDNYRFSAAVAAFSQLLRGGRYTESFSFDGVTNLVMSARGKDRFGYRGELQRLVNLAASLDG